MTDTHANCALPALSYLIYSCNLHTCHGPGGGMSPRGTGVCVLSESTAVHVSVQRATCSMHSTAECVCLMLLIDFQSQLTGPSHSASPQHALLCTSSPSPSLLPLVIPPSSLSPLVTRLLEFAFAFTPHSEISRAAVKCICNRASKRHKTIARSAIPPNTQSPPHRQCTLSNGSRDACKCSEAHCQLQLQLQVDLDVARTDSPLALLWRHCVACLFYVRPL